MRKLYTSRRMNRDFGEMNLGNNSLIQLQAGLLGFLPASAIEIDNGLSRIRAITTQLSGVEYQVCPILRKIDGEGFVGLGRSDTRQGVACQYYDAGECRALRRRKICGYYKGS